MKAPLKEYKLDRVLRLFKIVYPKKLETLTPYIYKSKKGENIEFMFQFDFTDETYKTVNIIRTKDNQVKGFFKIN